MQILLPKQSMSRRGQVSTVSGSKLMTQPIVAHAEVLTRCTTMSLWELKILSLESSKEQSWFMYTGLATDTDFFGSVMS